MTDDRPDDRDEVAARLEELERRQRLLALQMRRGYLMIVRAIEEEYDIRPAERESRRVDVTRR